MSHAQVGRFRLETCLSAVEEFTELELLYQHLRGVGTVLIKTWERETGGRRGEEARHLRPTQRSHLPLFVCLW